MYCKNDERSPCSAVDLTSFLEGIGGGGGFAAGVGCVVGNLPPKNEDKVSCLAFGSGFEVEFSLCLLCDLSAIE